jgi:glycosyltransferase involved in cell wall biosynthesis
VIATNHGGIPDQVIDGETGFLVDEGDWEAMADRMLLLARSPMRRQTMGEAARRNIEIVGDLTVQVRKLRAVLENASSGACTPSYS